MIQKINSRATDFGKVFLNKIGRCKCEYVSECFSFIIKNFDNNVRKYANQNTGDEMSSGNRFIKFPTALQLYLQFNFWRIRKPIKTIFERDERWNKWYDGDDENNKYFNTNMTVTWTELSIIHHEIGTSYPKVNILFGFFCSTQNPARHVNRLKKSTKRIVEHTDRPL